MERVGLYLGDVEILRLHYAETLKAWRQRFRARWEEAAKLYDHRFCRMWDFYLAPRKRLSAQGVTWCSKSSS
jgi:cyclopropane-fatty-acyl-phospholipid synthase